MALVVQHNLTAMNANRQLGIISGAQSKATEKLSSGYQINRAGDDAAGLTISEKMRSQINGLNKASKNAQDGVSLIQSAEGALNEAHSILQRMNELAVQGANDTNQSIDRDAINQELQALTDELDRISDTTQFNKQNLLDGTFTGKNLHVGANTNQRIEISINAMNASALGLGTVNKKVTSVTVRGTASVAAVNSVASQVAGFSVGKYTVNGGQYTTFESAAKVAASAKVTDNDVALQVTWSADASGDQVYVYNNTAYSTLAKATSVARDYVVSAEATDIATHRTSIDNKAASTTSIRGIVFGGNSWSAIAGVAGVPGKPAIADQTSIVRSEPVYAARVDSYSVANATISKVQEAINRVSKQRSALGALQNRLEHTIANLDTVSENTAAAESRIRDTDMASQMVEYSKNNILAQAGQSMLAQANQSTQGVLSLLG